MSGGRTPDTLKPMKHPKFNGGATSGGVGPRQLHIQKNLKHSKLNEGKRPVGLDQDRAQAPKVNRDSLVKKRSRHMDAMTNPKPNERQCPVEELRL